MNRFTLFRMLTFVTFLPFVLVMSTAACGDPGAPDDVLSDGHGPPSAEEAATPSSISGIWALIETRTNAIAKLIQSNQLKGIHTETEALGSLGDQLLKSSTMLDEGKLARVRGAVNQMGRVADSLHDDADKGDAAGAAAEFEKLKGLLKLIEAQYPAGALSSSAEEKGARASVSPEETMAMDTHALHHHDHSHQGKEPEQPVPPDAQRILIQANDFSFAPKEISVKSGRPVAITLTNRGASAHDWMIASRPDVHIHVLPGKTETRVFTFDTPAQYAVVCTLPGHEKLGMIGKIVIN